MNKRAIWVIIGLMSAALIGIIILQVYWINWSYQLGEQQFSKDVFAALNRVSNKLQRAENIKDEFTIVSQSGLGAENYPGGIPLDVSSPDYIINIDSLEKYQEAVEELFRKQQNLYPNDPKKQLKIWQQQENLLERLEYSRQANPQPVAERIDLQTLDKTIRKELKNRNINLEFNYGVYSSEERAFVITDGHFVVHDSNPQAFAGGSKNLFTSIYKVDLFPEDLKSPGQLLMYFPGKVGLFWGALWKTLLSSIIFTSLILFCFAYTIQVIFFQKKVGEMKTDFINNMTHEFKTPIATISLAADSITSPMILGNSEKVKRFADIIKQENKRMNKQVEKVLQMAVIDKEEFSLKITDINLHDVINNAVSNISLQVDKKSGTVQTNLKASKPIVQGDLTHITNVIHNLLDNANKYSPDKPEITVHTRDVSNGVEVIVEDKGMGMTKEAKKYIFDKFYRVHTGNRHDVKGFGLGLSYVKAMITAHNGQIEVRSELDKGSKFIITLPKK
jgi:two-component system phosphate regulon sensor histidine kinase PhoR